MKILYDHQIFALQKIGGISRYFYELIRSSQHRFFPCLATKYHKNIHLKNMLESRQYPKNKNLFPEHYCFPGKDVISKIHKKIFPIIDIEVENQNYVREQLVKVKPDIFHPTYYGDYFLNDLNGTPFIFTIYDMIHEIYPEHFNNNKVQNLKKKLFFLADHVIAISDTTKKDIMDIYNVSGEKISVVYLATSLTRNDCTKGGFTMDLPERYLLYIGLRQGYKNFQFFITAISEILKNDNDLYVICTGPLFTKSELELFNSLGISNKICNYWVGDDELAHLYGKAIAFVLPSIYEGFGIPILEAFACECPVVLSHTPSLAEVGGDAAVYFNPKSIIEMRDAVGKVIYDSELRRCLVQKGKERSNYFSWSTTVEKTSDVYKKCLEC